MGGSSGKNAGNAGTLTGLFTRAKSNLFRHLYNLVHLQFKEPKKHPSFYIAPPPPPITPSLSKKKKKNCHFQDSSERSNSLMIFLTNLGEMKIKVSLFIGLKKEKKIKDSEAQFQVRRKRRQFQVEKKMQATSDLKICRQFRVRTTCQEKWWQVLEGKNAGLFEWGKIAGAPKGLYDMQT